MNQRQTIFVSAYLKSGNATESAIASGYSSKTARSQGQRLLTNVDIQKSIKQAQDRVSKNTGITVAQVVKRIDQLGRRTKKDNVKAKCLDMLMKHVGGYVNELTLLSKMTDEDLEKLSSNLMDKMN